MEEWSAFHPYSHLMVNPACSPISILAQSSLPQPRGGTFVLHYTSYPAGFSILYGWRASLHLSPCFVTTTYSRYLLSNPIGITGREDQTSFLFTEAHKINNCTSKSNYNILTKVQCWSSLRARLQQNCFISMCHVRHVSCCAVVICIAPLLLSSLSGCRYPRIECCCCLDGTQGKFHGASWGSMPTHYLLPFLEWLYIGMWVSCWALLSFV